MSAVSYDANSRFVFTTTKRVDLQPDVTWQNTYEFNAVVPGFLADLVQLANVLAAFEAVFLRTIFTITTVRISTWLADSHPYDPTSFVTVSAMVPGTNAMFGPNLPLQECFEIHRDGGYGRLGLLEWRGVLNLAEVNPGLTGWEHDDPAGAQVSLTGAIVSSGLVAYLGDSADELQMGMIDKNGAFRPVFNLLFAGVNHVKLKHKWYNRS